MRDQILELAMKQLADGGYSELNFGQIAKALGITRANIHYHYDGKASLAAAAVEAYMEDFHHQFDEVYRATAGDHVAFFKALEALHWSMSEDSGRAHVCVCSPLLMNSDKIPEALSQSAWTYFGRIQARVLQRLHEAQAAGALKSGRTPEDLSREFAMLMFGYMQMAQALGEQTSEDEVRSTIARWAESI